MRCHGSKERQVTEQANPLSLTHSHSPTLTHPLSQATHSHALSNARHADTETRSNAQGTDVTQQGKAVTLTLALALAGEVNKALTCDEPMRQGRFPLPLHLHLLLLQYLVVVVRGDSTSLWASAPIQACNSIYIPL